MDSLVDIIVPEYNAGLETARLLDSLANQSVLCFNVIIVDDASSDDSASFIERHISEIPLPFSTTVLRLERNGGPGVARNAGLSQAICDYILFVDADDEPDTCFVESLIKPFVNNRDIDFCFAQYRRVDKGGYEQETIMNKGGAFSFKRNCPEDLFVSLIKGEVHISLWNSAFRRSVIEASRCSFNSSARSAEDIDFIGRYLTNCKTCGFVERVVYTYNYDSQRAMMRYNDDSSLPVIAPIYIALRDVFISVGWLKAAKQIDGNKIPTVALYRICIIASQCPSYSDFLECRKKCDIYYQAASRISPKCMKWKSYMKRSLLLKLYHLSKPLFYFVIGHSIGRAF